MLKLINFLKILYIRATRRQVSLSDCYMAMRGGYAVQVKNGRVIGYIKEKSRSKKQA